MTPTSIGGSSALQQQLQAMFAKVDLNADGLLSADEFQSIGQSLPQPGSSGQTRPLRGDAGGGPNFAAATLGSLLSMQESRAETIFSSVDSNGDGTLTADEIATDMAAHAPPDAPAGTDTATMAARFVSTADTDGDGLLSLDEFKAAKPPHGAHGGGDVDAASKDRDPLDTNSDGKVSVAELLASLQTSTQTQTGFSSDASTLLARLIAQLTADLAANSTTAVAA